MAAKTGRIWALDLGNDSLKALHLSTERGVVEVIGFDNIPHGKVLSGAGIKEQEKQELIALTLRKFVSKHELGMDEIAIGVPSQNSFARFVNLPPVEKKRMTEIVKFEAVQQIPFDINDVQWAWQLMTEPDSPELKVGIFAIKNEVVNAEMEHFGRENLQVSYVQMSPMALYNYLVFDRPDLVTSDNQAVVVINIGADNTDLVVCTKSTVWQRCILIGGNAFTKAIADAFKLSFEKAEKLKRTAPVSKYARQIFQAMKPVFGELASEVQRSLGFYTSSNPSTKLTRIIGMGGGTKLRGLLKYLQQTLQIPVEMPDAFKRLAISSAVSPAKFHENVTDFGVVYGLALQGLGLARIESNLLPRSVVRSMAWAGKSRWFIAAAVIFLVVSLLSLGRAALDTMSYARNDSVRRKTNSVLNEVSQAISKLEQEQQKGSDYKAIIDKELEPFNYRNIVPLLHQTIISELPNEKNNPMQRGLYEAFSKSNVEEVMKIPRKERKQVFITSISAYYANDLSTAQFGVTDFKTRSVRTTGRADQQLEMEMEMLREQEMMMAQQSRGGPQYLPLQGAAKPAEPNSGFVVTIAGYSPYKSLDELMDPPGVENQPDKWGFVTRLLHLADVNGTFTLFKKTESEQHFKLEIHDVGLGTDAAMPAGIGVEDIKLAKTASLQYAAVSGGEVTLIDPMTKEMISREAEFDEFGKPKLDRSGKPVYKVNDHWFVLNLKFVWKNAPKLEPPATTQPTSAYSTTYAQPTTTKSSTSSVEKPSIGRRRGVADYLE